VFIYAQLCKNIAREKTTVSKGSLYNLAILVQRDNHTVLRYAATANKQEKCLRNHWSSWTLCFPHKIRMACSSLQKSLKAE